MRYPIDCENNFSKTYLFWLSRFIRSKITSLSNRQVTNKDRLAQIIQELIKGFDNIEDLRILIKEVRMLMTGDAANQATFLFDKFSHGITSYEKSMKELLSKTYGKFDKILLSHGSGDAPKELLVNIIQLCEDIKAGNADDVPFDFMGQRAYIAKKANEQFDRVDGGVGNIIYSKEKINQ